MDIYGHFLSAPANQVRLSVSALGVEANYHHVDLMTGQQKTPEFQAVNRFGKVPALVDGELKLAESNAICRYLGQKVGGDCFPADPAQQAVVDQWMEFSAHHIRANMSKVLFNKLFAPMMNMPIDENSLREGQDFLNQYLPMVEQQLGQSSYVTGESMTLADVALISAMEPFEKMEFSLADYPNISAWRSNIMAQEFYQKVHAHYGAEMES